MQAFEISTVLAASPMRVYCTWLDSQELSAAIGSPVHVEPVNGGRFAVPRGQVQSYILDQKPYRQIVQVWRTPDVACCNPDSLVSLMFEPADCSATRLTVQHVGVPDAMVTDYRRAWLNDYLEPMRRYFAEG